MTRVNAPSHLDFQSYINNYTGRTAIDRAIYIGEHCDSLEVEALQWAADAIKNTTRDTNKYSACMTQLNEACKKRGLKTIEVDQAWLATTQRENEEILDSLDAELKGYKNNMIKEKIRDCMTRQGDCYYQAGDFANAIKCYIRTRDHSTTSAHTLETCFNVIKASVSQGNFTHVSSYANRVEAVSATQKKELVQSKLEACRALVSLYHKEKYSWVADALTKVSFEMGNSLNDIISANDIAVYGGLCALASYDRQELKTKVLSNSSFKSYLELEPQIREMIDAFYHAKYSVCLELLESYRNDYLLDMYLAPHVPALFKLIRERALVQYCVPYGKVDLQRMATAFQTSVPDLQKELADLIGEGDKISARIDSHQKILISKKRDQRQQALKRSMKAGSDYEKATKALMLRMKLLKADMIVKSN
ncbi:hypothetical protein LRAMOSA02529 [Lichtheimia ramosa]|uniref:PCI domain-containing protein n=1 Tax=Lichtheimia ramosa TaxID=688394 RepID=A0A077WT46_9FUNG|nr:hypothetical protein LRAMOSA02529 [Lichtheimia ramosa]